jgi:hypothetical protein
VHEELMERLGGDGAALGRAQPGVLEASDRAMYGAGAGGKREGERLVAVFGDQMESQSNGHVERAQRKLRGHGLTSCKDEIGRSGADATV